MIFLHIFSGIVTNDQLVDCGLFVLDNKVIVCQSTLCVITNIRKVKLGMKVAINNVHTIKLKSLGKIGMILCARGRLDILKDQGNTHDTNFPIRITPENYKRLSNIRKCH